MNNNLNSDIKEAPVAATAADGYICTIDNVKETLAKHGVAVITGVLTEAECEETIKGMWDYLELATSQLTTPMDRNKQETWKQIEALWPKNRMLLQHFGIGHAQFLWMVRQNPKVCAVYAKIWDVTVYDLLVSYDGASCHLPQAYDKPSKAKKLSLHCDQSFSDSSFKCVQGWVTAYDVRHGDATLCVLPESHLLHQHLARACPLLAKDKKDWKMMEQSHLNFYSNKNDACTPTMIACPKGSLVLWDSRTIHCGVQSSLPAEQAAPRCVVYVSMMPKSTATPSQRARHRAAFDNGRTTSHWANKATLFSNSPHAYGKPVAPIKHPPHPNRALITALGRSLI